MKKYGRCAAMETREAPLHAQVRHDIKERLLGGSLLTKDGRPPTQHELAKHYTVSLNTIKKAIADLEQEGVLQSRRGKGLVLGTGAELTIRKTNEGRQRVGVGFHMLYDAFSNPFLAKIMKGMAAADDAAAMDTHPFGYPQDAAPEAPSSLEYQADALRLDAVALLSTASISSLATLKRRGVPFLFIGNQSVEEATSLCADLVLGFYLLTDAVLRRGCRRIAFFPGNPHKHSHQHRLMGYRLAHEKHQLKPPMELVDLTGEETLDGQMGFLERTASLQDGFDAVIAPDDLMVGALRGPLARLGRGGVLLAGAGNLDSEADRVDCTIDLQLERQGEDGMRLLASFLRGEPPSTTKRWYDPLLVERQLGKKR